MFREGDRVVVLRVVNPDRWAAGMIVRVMPYWLVVRLDVGLVVEAIPAHVRYE